MVLAFGASTQPDESLVRPQLARRNIYICPFGLQVASSLANLKLGHQPTGSVGGHPFRSGSRDEAGGKGVAATSSIIEYHGNYKELPSNQDNLSAAALAQVSTKGSVSLLIITRSPHLDHNTSICTCSI